MKLSLILEEKIYIKSDYSHKPTMILVNPLPQTIIRMIETMSQTMAGKKRNPYYVQLAGIISKGDLYIWDRFEADHETVADRLNIETDVAFYIDPEKIVEDTITKLKFAVSRFSSPNAMLSELLKYPAVKEMIEILRARDESLSQASSI